jgi:uncharacterized membrane protein YccF (DUF307 family)
MRSLKYFKISEILHVDIFDIICTSQTYNIMKFQLNPFENHKTMSMQNLWITRSKNNKKNTYYFYINDMSFLLVMFWYEIHMVYILTKFVQLS